jgi:hypothetical protein
VVPNVGSFNPNSLADSHLGRSLQAASGFAGFTPTNGMPAGSAGGLPPRSGGAPSAAQPTGGGIGGQLSDSRLTGLGDSFHPTSPISPPSLDSFKIIKVIGKGSFGKVFLVRENVTNEMFALKVLRKDNIIKRNQVEHTRTERNVLGYVKHPFIVGLNMAFQTKDKLYFVLDYCAGGELFFHLGKLGKFPEPRAKVRRERSERIERTTSTWRPSERGSGGEG